MKKSESPAKKSEKKTRTKKEGRQEKLTRGQRRREWAAAFLVVLGLSAFLGIAALVQRVFIPLSYYNKAEKLVTEGLYREAAQQFKKAGAFSDSKDRITECEGLQIEKDYQAAIALYENGKYDEAMTAFAELDGYSSSRLYQQQSQYGRAQGYLESGDYDSARTDFAALGDFSDSLEMIKECVYRKAGRFYEEEKYAEAVELYASIADYKDSTQLGHKAQADFNLQHLRTAEVGDTVLFGRYEQDGNAENGVEDLEWIVLERNESGVMLISRYLLAEQKMSSGNVSFSIEWADCKLRTWCNTTFLEKAFTEAEKAAIMTTTVSATKNGSSGLSSASTKDKVFVLSLEEVRKYFPTEEARMASPTEAAVSDGLFEFAEGTSIWWLRTRGANNSEFIYFSVVNYFGFIDYTRGISYDSTDVGVRPVIWVSVTE